MEACLNLVQIFAYVAYTSLILVITSGLLLDVMPIVEHIQTRIRIFVHALCGTALTIFSFLHVYQLNCTDFNFKKIYDPIHYFDILAFSGVLALLLLTFVLITSLLRKYLNKFWWNNLHNLSYVVFFLVSVHAFFKGDDTFKLISIYASLLIALLFLIRVIRGNKLFY